MIVYFDNAATTKPRDEAAAAMRRAVSECWGNPSSAHFAGRTARDLLEASRKSVADALGAATDEVFFTSGGTEADNWAVTRTAEAFARHGKHVICSAVEHDAVLKPVSMLVNSGWQVSRLTPNSSGQIPVESFADALRDDTILASVMLVNNESGAVNPVADYAAEIKKRKLGTILHTDAVQAFCKIPFSVKTLGADLLTVSAHKIHGVKGAGALYIRNGIKLPPLILGGGQEHDARAGTEALPAIAAFGEAARLGSFERADVSARVSKLRDYTCSLLREHIPGAVTLEGGSPYILTLSLPGYKSEVLMNFLEREGVCVSNSAACKKGARSRVLEAMRIPNAVIDGAIRVSFSRYSTMEEADFFIETLKKASETILKPL